MPATIGKRTKLYVPLVVAAACPGIFFSPAAILRSAPLRTRRLPARCDVRPLPAGASVFRLAAANSPRHIFSRCAEAARCAAATRAAYTGAARAAAVAPAFPGVAGHRAQ